MIIFYNKLHTVDRGKDLERLLAEQTIRVLGHTHNGTDEAAPDELLVMVYKFSLNIRTMGNNSHRGDRAGAC